MEVRVEEAAATMVLYNGQDGEQISTVHTVEVHYNIQLTRVTASTSILTAFAFHRSYQQ